MQTVKLAASVLIRFPLLPAPLLTQRQAFFYQGATISWLGDITCRIGESKQTLQQ